VTYLMPFGWEEVVAESRATFHGYKTHKQLAEQMKNAYKAAETIIDKYDFVIYEQFFFLGKHLAEKYHKPVARIFTAPVANKILMQEYISSKGPLSIFKFNWIARAFTKDIAKTIPLKTDNWLDEIIENPPELNLVYTLREYQPFEEEFPKEQYKFLGPSIYERERTGFEVNKEGIPVIYISLGTILKGPTSFYRNCIEAFRGENIEVIISASKSFSVSKLKNVPENVRIYTSVPQLEVLEKADIFITHGGMNSISEALVCGVSMVVIPFVSDQPVNARCVEKLGVGKKLEYKDVTKDILRDTVWNVMEDESINENMKKVQEMLTEAPGNKGGAEYIMEYYRSGKWKY